MFYPNRRDARPFSRERAQQVAVGFVRVPVKNPMDNTLKSELRLGLLALSNSDSPATQKTSLAVVLAGISVSLAKTPEQRKMSIFEWFSTLASRARIQAQLANQFRSLSGMILAVFNYLFGARQTNFYLN